MAAPEVRIRAASRMSSVWQVLSLFAASVLSAPLPGFGASMQSLSSWLRGSGAAGAPAPAAGSRAPPIKSKHDAGMHAQIKLQEYYSLAETALNRACDADDQRDYAAALRLYETALAAIDEGLQLNVPGAWLDASNASRQRSTLSTWHQLAQDRVRVLQSRSSSTSGPAVLPATRITAVKSQQPSRAAAGRPSHAATGGGAVYRRTASQPAARPAPRPSPASGAAGGKAAAEDARLREVILSEVLDQRPSDTWADIAGLAGAKQALNEMVILPAQRADLFKGLRTPARGLLLYGPPGNGKTMLARALAHEARATFFNISAATLTSKWHGEAEKLVRALFKTAAEHQPAIIFIDEIDSILSERSAGEHEASRRLKTEFLVQFDGVAGGSDAVVVIGATNRPQELDDAIRRRLVKRIYIPLPNAAARAEMLQRLLEGQPARLRRGDIQRLVAATEGYSGSDINALCREAAMVPLRELGPAVATVPADRIRPIELPDFGAALQATKPSVSQGQLASFEQWTRDFGVTA